MRDPKRIKRILKKLEAFWEEHPDWRLGQIVSNMKGVGPQDVFYMEDGDLEVALDEWLTRGKPHQFS